MRRTSIILDMPSELLHEIYDLLEVDDRLSLNRALPPRRRVLKTSRTSVKDDRALYAMSRALKRMPPDRRGGLIRKRGPLRRFLISHATDPTVRAIAIAASVEMGSVRLTDVELLPVAGATSNAVRSKAEALVAALEAGDVAALRAFTAGSAGLASETDGGLASAGGAMVELLRERLHQPDFVDAILGDAVACEVFCSAVRAAAPFGPRISLFDLLNHLMFDLVERLLAMGSQVRAAFGVRDEDVREFMSSHSVAILCCRSSKSGETARFVLRKFGDVLSDARRATLLEDAVEHANVRAVEAWLM